MFCVEENGIEKGKEKKMSEEVKVEQVQEMQETKQMKTAQKGLGIPGSTLKLIAIGTMFIDHTAAVILDRLLMSGKIGDLAAFSVNPTANQTLAVVSLIDLFMRLIGRLGFPLFCFLLIEGFHYTHSRLQYAVRLFLFALISEVPFDLAFKDQVLEFTYQNVFFTLFLGFLTIWALDAGLKWLLPRFEGKVWGQRILKVLLTIVIGGIGITVANLLKTDYAGIGVATLIIMYFFKEKSRTWEMVGGCIVLTVMNLMEVTAFATVPIVRKYNGTRGLKLKYVFYLFYPVHLLVLYGISVTVGL